MKEKWNCMESQAVFEVGNSIIANISKGTAFLPKELRHRRRSGTFWGYEATVSNQTSLQIN